METHRTFTYDDAGKLLSATETEDNYGTYVYSYEYDLMGNRSAVIKTNTAGEVVESRKYVYNESNQLVSVELFDGKKTTSVSYTYDADGNLVSEIGRDGTDKVELTYTYTVENRLEAVYDKEELLMAAAYDGDGNRVFQLNYNLHTDEDWKGNSGNGNGSNKDNAGSGSSGNGNSSSSGSNGNESNSSSGNNGNSSGNNGNGNGNSGNNGNGSGNNKNKGNSGNSSANNGKGGNGKNNGNVGNKGNSGNNGNGNNGNGTSNSGNGNFSSNGTDSSNGSGNSTDGGTGNGNATNAETNNSQNQSGILFPIASETSDTESYLISLIKTTGKEKNYELIEYINDVNREYAEVLVEQNINGALDTAYVYGAAIGAGSDRLSLDRFDGSIGYYLYDPRGSVTGITNEEGQVYQSYRYSVFGEITFGAPQYENEYTYNGESYNPNIKSQYLRVRYYCVVTADFLTEDSYLGNITEPLTLNRYNYCVGSPLNYTDPSGNKIFKDLWDSFWNWITGANDPVAEEVIGTPLTSTPSPAPTQAPPEIANSGTSALDFLAKPLPPIPEPALPATPTEVPECSNFGGESSIFGENYLDMGAGLADSKTNAEDCILLDEAYCKVEGYEKTYIVEFLKKFESFRASPYYATATEEANNILTIGYGHVIKSEEKDIYVADYVMTEAEATKVLEEDILSHFPSDIIDEVLKVHGPLTQNQLDALVALAFNNSDFNIIESPKFTRILVNENYFGEGFDQMVMDEFMTYNKQGGEILGGLVKRSTAEAILFLENNYFTEYDDLYSNPEALEKYKNFLEKYGYDDLVIYIK